MYCSSILDRNPLFLFLLLSEIVYAEPANCHRTCIYWEALQGKLQELNALEMNYARAFISTHFSCRLSK